MSSKPTGQSRINPAQGEPITSLDATLPPTAAGDPSGAHGAHVLVFSHDAELCNVITTAARNRYSTRIIDKWWDVLSQVEARRGRIVLVDVDALGIPLERGLKELKSRADWLVVVIAARQAQAQELMRFWSERKIHRLLIKPAAVGITRLLLESAVSRYLELDDAYGGVDDDSITVPSRPRPRFGLKYRLRKPMAAVTGLLVVAGALYSALWLRETFFPADTDPVELAVVLPDEATEPLQPELEAVPEPADTPIEPREPLAEPQPVAPVSDSSAVEPTAREPEPGAAAPDPAPVEPRRPEPAQQDDPAPLPAASEDPAPRPEPEPLSELDSMLTIATLRLEQGQLIEPSGDSARDYFERASAIDAGNPDVLVLREAFGRALANEARTAFDAGNFDHASTLIAAGTRLGIAEAGLAELRAEIAEVVAEREAAAADRRRQEEQQLADSVSEHIVQGSLIGSGDSALEALNALRERNPQHPSLADLNQALVAAIITRVGNAISSGEWDAAENHLIVLREIAAEQSTVNELGRRLEIERRQDSYLANSIPIGRLQVINAVAPVYPRDALRTEVTGWVELEFIVDREGSTRTIAVVDSEPVGQFEDAAVAAVQQYEFEPFIEDGQVYERRVRVRIRFELD